MSFVWLVREAIFCAFFQIYKNIFWEKIYKEKSFLPCHVQAFVPRVLSDI